LVFQISESHGTMIKIYKTMYVFHSMERTWTQHDVLREYLDIKRQQVTGQWIKLHNEDLHNLQCSSNITMIKIKAKIGCLMKVKRN